jgi:phage tail-like protein
MAPMTTPDDRGAVATAPTAAPATSTYLTYLPALFQEETSETDPGFLAAFLRAFEHVLTGAGDASDPGLEEILDGTAGLRGIERYFDPGYHGGPVDASERAPSEFLPWLAGWVALAIRADIDDARRRELIAKALWLYRRRGTRAGLEELIRIYTALAPTIVEFTGEFQIGVSSTIGVDTIVDGASSHFFRVIVRLSTKDPAEQARWRAVLTAILDAEKPAHTHYDLEIRTPILRVEVTSTIGVDTLIGTHDDTIGYEDPE